MNCQSPAHCFWPFFERLRQLFFVAKVLINNCVQFWRRSSFPKSSRYLICVPLCFAFANFFDRLQNLNGTALLQIHCPLQIYVGGWLGITHQKGLSLGRWVCQNEATKRNRQLSFDRKLETPLCTVASIFFDTKATFFSRMFGHFFEGPMYRMYEV